MAHFEANEFKEIETSISKYDEEREKLIQQSREIIKQSKVVINGIHRNEDVKKELAELENQKKKLQKIIKNKNELSDEGMAKVAFQEYAEAKLFHDFISGKKLSKQVLGISDEHYLLGVCDLTGELARMAVLSATKQKYDMVKKIQELIEEIHTFFLRLNLRNSELRKKSDQIKWNLKKVEDILYDVSLRQN